MDTQNLGTQYSAAVLMRGEFNQDIVELMDDYGFTLSSDATATEDLLQYDTDSLTGSLEELQEDINEKYPDVEVEVNTYEHEANEVYPFNYVEKSISIVV